MCARAPLTLTNTSAIDVPQRLCLPAYVCTGASERIFAHLSGIICRQLIRINQSICFAEVLAECYKREANGKDARK